VLAYPVISSGKYAHRDSFENLLGQKPGAELLEETSLELHVTGAAPPSFIWHTFADESVPLENSLLFAGALREAGVPFELHVYPSGPHGLSLATQETEEPAKARDPHVATWMLLCVQWLRGIWT
jgi:acetyl esterase/lipase